MGTITDLTYKEIKMSFRKLWESIEDTRMDQPIDDKAMSAIRTGIGIRDTFWDDFLQLVNNADGLSDLLDVPEEKIIAWRHHITKNLNKVQDSDKSQDVQRKNKILKTGQPE